MHAFKSIMVPTDYSHTADQALQQAALLAKEVKAKLLVTHVVPPYDPLYFEYAGISLATNSGAAHRATKKLADHVAGVLGKVAARLQLEVAWGDPAQQIVDLAAKRGCDLIVMGRNGENPWERLLIGSVAEKVVRASSCPVLTVAKQVPARVSVARQPVRRQTARGTRRRAAV